MKKFFFLSILLHFWSNSISVVIDRDHTDIYNIPCYYDTSHLLIQRNKCKCQSGRSFTGKGCVSLKGENFGCDKNVNANTFPRDLKNVTKVEVYDYKENHGYWNGAWTEKIRILLHNGNTEELKQLLHGYILKLHYVEESCQIVKIYGQAEYPVKERNLQLSKPGDDKLEADTTAAITKASKVTTTTTKTEAKPPVKTEATTLNAAVKTKAITIAPVKTEATIISEATIITAVTTEEITITPVKTEATTTKTDAIVTSVSTIETRKNIEINTGATEKKSKNTFTTTTGITIGAVSVLTLILLTILSLFIMRQRKKANITHRKETIESPLEPAESEYSVPELNNSPEFNRNNFGTLSNLSSSPARSDRLHSFSENNFTNYRNVVSEYNEPEANYFESHYHKSEFEPEYRELELEEEYDDPEYAYPQVDIEPVYRELEPEFINDCQSRQFENSNESKNNSYRLKSRISKQPGIEIKKSDASNISDSRVKKPIIPKRPKNLQPISEFKEINNRVLVHDDDYYSAPADKMSNQQNLEELYAQVKKHSIHV